MNRMDHEEYFALDRNGNDVQRLLKEVSNVGRNYRLARPAMNWLIFY